MNQWSASGLEWLKKEREKSRRTSRESYARKKYETQIKELTDGTDFNEKSVTVWVGRLNDGDWVSATQLTPYGMVSDGVGEKNKPKQKFRGAIVALGDKKNRQYKAVPSPLFKRLGECQAKWEFHTGAKEYTARVWSGTYFCSEQRHGKKRGYIFVDFGNMKTKGMENRRWVPDLQVRVFNPGSSQADGVVDHEELISSSYYKQSYVKRAKKSIDRYSPSKSDSKQSEPEEPEEHDDLSYFGSNNIKCRRASQDERKKYYKSFTSIGLQLMGEKKGVPPKVPDFFRAASRVWTYEQKQKHKESLAQFEMRKKSAAVVGREFTEPVPRIHKATPPHHPLMELSLIFDIMRGETIGDLGEGVNEAFGVHHLEEHCYLNAIKNICAYNDEKEQKEARKMKQKKKCKVKGCPKQVHTIFHMDCVCYRHGDKNKKKPKNSSAQSAPRRTDLSVGICVHHVSTRKQCTNHMGLGTITQILGRCAVCAMCANLSRWGGGAPTAAEIELIIQQRKIQQRETKLRTLYCTGPFLFICHIRLQNYCT